eukprot:4023269-Amphidinium_carterae.1
MKLNQDAWDEFNAAITPTDHITAVAAIIAALRARGYLDQRLGFRKKGLCDGIFEWTFFVE